MRRFIVVTLALGLLGPALYAGGGKESGGGDAFAQEFASLGRLIAKAIGAKRLALKHVTWDRFNYAVETTRVITAERVYFKKAEVDARNYPKKHLIVLSRSRWRSYHGFFRYKLSLVLHEYVGILGSSDTHYALSSEYLPALEGLSNKTLEQLLLSRIDALCGDTWCEGDFNYDFVALKCGADGCTLKFIMKELLVLKETPQNTKVLGESADTTISSSATGSFREFDVACTFRQFTHMEELAELSLSSHTRDIQLNEAFHRALNDCIESLEKQLSAELVPNQKGSKREAQPRKPIQPAE